MLGLQVLQVLPGELATEKEVGIIRLLEFRTTCWLSTRAASRPPRSRIGTIWLLGACLEVCCCAGDHDEDKVRCDAHSANPQEMIFLRTA